MANNALDSLTKEEEAQLRQMEQDDRASTPTTVDMVQDGDTAPDRDAERAAPEAEPDAPEPEAKEEPKESKESQLVDKRALDQERERRRKAEAASNELAVKHAAELAKAQTRLDLLMQASQEHLNQQQAPAARAEPEPEPDMTTDPAGYIKHQFTEHAKEIAQLKAENARVQQYTQQQWQQAEQARQREELRQWGIGEEAKFAAEQPDYNEATQYLTQQRIKMIQALGITNPVEIQGALEADAFQTCATARQRGMSFGKLLYDVATAHGYTPGAKAPAASVAADRGSAAPAAIAVPDAAPPATSAVERLLRGQEMAAGLGATGAAPRGDVAITAIAAMSDHEFEKYYAGVKKNGKAAMHNLFGG